MAKYRPVLTRIWKDRDFLSLGKDSKLIFLYLITNESCNNSGVYEIPIATISHETGVPQATVKQLLGNGSIKNIIYDVENEIVFVMNARKYSPGGNPAQVEKGVLSEFQHLGKTFLWNSFLELYPEFKTIFSTVDQPLVKGTLPLPLPLPLKDLTNNKPLKMDIEEWFEEDWKLYPKKGHKKTALRHYKRTVNTPEKRELFLDKMTRYVDSVENPQYLKLGETFFNQWPDLEISDQIEPKQPKSWQEKEDEAFLNGR